MDDLLTEAQREVDDLLPGTPKIAPPRPRPSASRSPNPSTGMTTLVIGLVWAIILLAGVGYTFYQTVERVVTNERDLNLLHEQVFEARRQVLLSERETEAARDQISDLQSELRRAQRDLENARSTKGRRR